MPSFQSRPTIDHHDLVQLLNEYHGDDSGHERMRIYCTAQDTFPQEGFYYPVYVNGEQGRALLSARDMADLKWRFDLNDDRLACILVSYSK